jgi:hypothetical protein
MGGKPKQQRNIMETRARETPDGEPTYSETMSVRYAGNSLVIGLPVTGTNVLGVSDDDDLEVEVHENGFWVSVGGGDGEQ